MYLGSKRGWFRLWVVLTVIGVPAAAEWNFQHDEDTWRTIDKMTIELCVDEETKLPSHPDALACGHQRGADQTLFQHERISPARYWLTSLGIFFALDLVLTALLVAAFLAGRWVFRGFSHRV